MHRWSYQLQKWYGFASNVCNTVAGALGISLNAGSKWGMNSNCCLRRIFLFVSVTRRPDFWLHRVSTRCRQVEENLSVSFCSCVCTCSYYWYNYTVSQKGAHCFWQMSADFQNSFTDRKRMKLQQVKNFHLKCIATLPCERSKIAQIMQKLVTNCYHVKDLHTWYCCWLNRTSLQTHAPLVNCTVDDTVRCHTKHLTHAASLAFWTHRTGRHAIGRCHRLYCSPLGWYRGSLIWWYELRCYLLQKTDSVVGCVCVERAFFM